MTRKFESHITFDRKDSEAVQQLGAKYSWSFSAIDGDPVMGKMPYAYLTGYYTDGFQLFKMAQAVVFQASLQGVIALRVKVEEIIYDSKTGHDVLPT